MNMVSEFTERWELETVVKWQESVSTVEGRLFRGDFQVYRFAAPTMSIALARLSEISYKLSRFPVEITGRRDVNENMIGRPVYYREFKAIIADFDGERGRVKLRSDSPGVFGFPPEPWDGEDAERSQDVWEDLLSPTIHWHREEEA
jgi:hypothetical protein